MFSRIRVLASAKLTGILENIIEYLIQIIKRIEYTPYRWKVIIWDPFDVTRVLIQRRYRNVQDMQNDLKTSCFTQKEIFTYAKERSICLGNVIEFQQINERY